MMRASRWTALGIALALTACGESVGPDTQFDETDLVADVALIAAEAGVADVAEFATLIGDGPSASFATLSSASDRVTERSRSVTFLDAEGAVMDGYDDLLTASIVHARSLSREFEGPRMTASRESEREMTVSGLLGEETERTFDGTGSESSSRAVVTGNDSSRSYSFDGDVRVLSVVRAVDRTGQPWPLSGSIERDVTVTRTGLPGGDRTRTMSTVLTFDGTQFATLVVNGEEFTVDLAAPRGSRDSTSRGDRGGR